MKKRKKGLSSSSKGGFTAEDFFTNVEAQDFAFALLTRGVETLHEELERKPRQRISHIQRILAACEVVAAANGNPPATSGWCRMAETWLLESKFVPTPATVELAEQQLTHIISKARDSTFAVPPQDVKELLLRLQKPHRKIKWKAVKGDRPKFRALAKWLDTSQGEVSDGPQFDRSGNARVVLVYVTTNAACKLINYPKVPHLELWLNNQNDRKELAAALKILLRGWRNTLEILEFDHVTDLTINWTPPPYRALVECKAQLADLPALKRFRTQHMYFDDSVLEHVCQNRAILDISIDDAQITNKALETLGECKPLQEAYISLCPRIKGVDRATLERQKPPIYYFDRRDIRAANVRPDGDR